MKVQAVSFHQARRSNSMSSSNSTAIKKQNGLIYKGPTNVIFKGNKLKKAESYIIGGLAAVGSMLAYGPISALTGISGLHPFISYTVAVLVTCGLGAGVGKGISKLLGK